MKKLYNFIFNNIKNLFNFIVNKKKVYSIFYDLETDKAMYVDASWEEHELIPGDIIKAMENIKGFYGGGTRKLEKGKYYSFSYTKDGSGCFVEYIPIILKLLSCLRLIRLDI